MGLNVLKAIMSLSLIFLFQRMCNLSANYRDIRRKIPAASGPARTVHLTLTDDKRVDMSTDYLNDQPAVTETGTWESLKGGEISVAITGRDDQMYQKPEVITFRVNGETIEAVGYDREARGSEGLVTAETAGHHGQRMAADRDPLL